MKNPVTVPERTKVPSGKVNVFRAACLGTLCGDDPELASYLRIEERELDAGDVD